MKRRIFMVRISFRDANGRVGVTTSDRRARTPLEAIRIAIRSKEPRARVEGASAFPYVVFSSLINHTGES